MRTQLPPVAAVADGKFCSDLSAESPPLATPHDSALEPPTAFALAADTVAMPHPTDQTRWFTEEVDPHRGALRATVQRAFPGVRDVDDVVQDSLLRIWTARESRQIGCARAFLFKIARNRALDLLRHDQASPFVAIRDLATLSVAEDAPSPSDALSTAEKIELVAAASADLPDRCREIVVLRKFENRSRHEIAESVPSSASARPPAIPLTRL